MKTNVRIYLLVQVVFLQFVIRLKKIPDAAIVEAKIDGYKGGEGIVKFAQKHARPTEILVLLDGVKANAQLDVLHRRENVKDCYKMKKEDIKSSERLASVETDYNGMAILPWRELEGFDILTDNLTNTTIILIDTQTSEVVDCGKITVRNMTDYERAVNSSPQQWTSIWFLLLALCTLFIWIRP
jgi:hypothetical protein